MGRKTGKTYTSGEYALNIDEITRLLNTFDNIHEKAIIALDIVTGLRRLDVVSLERTNYVPTEATLKFYEHKKDAYRSIFIPSKTVIDILNEHLLESIESKWLFPSPIKIDSHISSRHVYDVFNEHLELAGLERRPFHSLRATCFQLAKASDWDMMFGSSLLGIGLQIAEEHYDAPSVGDMQAEARNKPLF